jgi:hypothetical protein
MAAFLQLAFLADHARQAGQFLRHAHVLGDHVVEGVGDLAEHAGPVVRQLAARPLQRLLVAAVMADSWLNSAAIFP